MFRYEEEKLNDYKKRYDNFPVPSKLLDDAIIEGLKKAKSERKNPLKKSWMFSLAAAVLLIGFLSSIRLSPAFASFVTDIPGMEKVVSLIQYDKGKMAAIENKYYQYIGKTGSVNGNSLTVDGAIADEGGLVVFYTYHSHEKKKNLSIESPQLKSKNGADLYLSSASYGSPAQGKGNTYSGTVEYFFDKPFSERELEFNAKVSGESYAIPISLKKRIKNKKTYNVNETVSIEGQKISVVDVEVTPLRAAVHIKLAKDNSKKILDFDDLRLVDDKGEEWAGVKNGTTGVKFSDDEQVLYLQSNYFQNPGELYLAFSKIQAVDKGDAYLVVDPVKQQIIKQPGSFFTSVKKVGSDLVLTSKEKFPYTGFGVIKDLNGKEINSHSSWQSSGETTEIGVDIPNLQEQKSNILLEIAHYPLWINGETKIKIK